MQLRSVFCLFAVAALLTAADASWKTKPAQEWTPEDAHAVLTDSPWAKPSIAGLIPPLNEDQRRESGNMGQPHGVGYDGVEDKHTRPGLSLADILLKPYTPHPPEYLPVLVRWETALPVRAAERKAREPGPPAVEGDGYRIAVYGIPGGNFGGTPKSLGDPLKHLAALRRGGKPDVKPTRVEVFQQPEGLVIVYLFPVKAELTRKDTFVEFDAQVGRVAIRQTFDITEMLFLGTLEL
jgi:hypothetical protein